MPRVYLIDASYFIFRAYYSMPPDMADPDGRPVNALYGFAKFLGDLLESERPSHVAIAFDESLSSSFRNKIYPPYKANREPAPMELKQQFSRCQELCGLMGLAAYSSSEYEADDIIGTLSSGLRSEGCHSVIVTRDKDLAQLIRHGDQFWDFAGGVRLDYGQIPARFGVYPERIADYLALTGDAVDNIPGVPGIGPKTAATLFAEFASLEELYANLPRVRAMSIRGAANVVHRLESHRETAFLARELTRIACDGPFEGRLERLRRLALQEESLTRFYDSAGFGSLLRRQAERIRTTTDSV